MISVEWFIFGICIALFIGVMAGARMLKPHRVKIVDGYLDVSAKDLSQIYQLELITPPDVLQTQKNLVLEVRKISSDS